MFRELSEDSLSFLRPWALEIGGIDSESVPLGVAVSVVSSRALGHCLFLWTAPVFSGLLSWAPLRFGMGRLCCWEFGIRPVLAMQDRILSDWE